MKSSNGMLCVVNPGITTRHGNMVESVEGCLSFPGRTVRVNRATRISVQYTTIKNKNICTYFEGLNAIIFQHELDHLNGITMMDRRKRQLTARVKKKKKRGK